MNVAPLTGIAVLTARVPAVWSNIADPTIDSVAVAAIVKTPSLTTLSLAVRVAPLAIATRAVVDDLAADRGRPADALR